MHFHGQMSTQPSHKMHSAWSMCRNCFGFTACVSHLGSTSCNTYEVENSGIGGLASVRATTTPHSEVVTGRPYADVRFERRKRENIVPPVIGVSSAAAVS